jgi:hypothetical protein
MSRTHGMSRMTRMTRAAEAGVQESPFRIAEARQNGGLSRYSLIG